MRRITTRQLTFAALFAALAVLLSVHPFTFYIVPTNLIVSLFLASLWLHVLRFDGGLSYWALLLSRLPLIAVMTVVHIILVMLLAPLAKRGIEGGNSK